MGLGEGGGAFPFAAAFDDGALGVGVGEVVFPVKAAFDVGGVGVAVGVAPAAGVPVEAGVGVGVAVAEGAGFAPGVSDAFFAASTTFWAPFFTASRNWSSTERRFTSANVSNWTVTATIRAAIKVMMRAVTVKRALTRSMVWSNQP